MKWIKCSEQMPEDQSSVLAYDSFMKAQVVAEYFPNFDSWCVQDLDEYDHFIESKDVTHWMPLPPKPEGD